MTVYQSWEPGYRALADETGFSVLDIAEAADEVRKMVTRIENAAVSDRSLSREGDVDRPAKVTFGVTFRAGHRPTSPSTPGGVGIRG